MSEGTRVRIEVVHARPGKQLIRKIELDEGSTVADAIDAARLEQDFPDLSVDPERVGIFGRRVSLDEKLRSGDRVEIYRPLIADPKEARRQRANKTRD